MALSPQTIQFKRRVGSAGAPGTLAEGEPALNDVSASVTNLYIGGQGGGAAVRTLISAARQVEMTGTQTIPTGAANAKTFDLTNFKLGGGAAGDMLTSDGAGGVDWEDAADIGTALASKVSVAVTAGIALTGNGLTATPLNLSYATNAEALTGTDAVKLITPATLQHVTGDLSTLDTTAVTSLVDAINELKDGLDTATAGGLVSVNTAGGMLSGLGTTASALTLTPASAGDISTGTNTANPINSAGLRSVSGDLTTLTTGITQTNLVAAINSVHTAMSDGSTVTVAVASPITGDGRTAAGGGTPLGLSTVPVTLGGTGAITAPLALDSLSGSTGAATGVLQRSNAGVWSLGTAFSGVEVEPGIAITGDGTSATPLDLTVATAAQINAAAGPFDDVFPITSAGLRGIMGGVVSAATLGTTSATVVPAIKEIADRVAAIAQPLHFVGTYNANTHVIEAGGTAPAGALPAAAAANAGWVLIVGTAGTGVAPAPVAALDIGDWIVSTGAGGSWVHVDLNMQTVMAGNVGIAAITGMTGVTNVQAALEWLYGNTMDSVSTDGASILGDGLAAGTPLSVGTVDGGTYT